MLLLINYSLCSRVCAGACAELRRRVTRVINITGHRNLCMSSTINNSHVSPQAIRFRCIIHVDVASTNYNRMPIPTTMGFSRKTTRGSYRSATAETLSRLILCFPSVSRNGLYTHQEK